MNYKKPKIALHSVSRMLRRYLAFLGRHPLLQQGIAFIILTLAFTAIGLQRLDPDFGWHFQAGEYIRAHGIPSHDIYTYTAQSFRWINHEWGNDVMLSLLYGWGGYALTAVFYGAIWALSLVVAGAGARLAILLAGAAAILPYAGVRPLGWTVLFFAITIRLLRSTNPKVRWWLPLIFVIWANIHAGFVAGLGLLVYFAIKERSGKTALLVLVCVLATLCNAYGWRIYEEVIRTIFDPALHHQISEWAYLTVLGASWFFIVIWATGFWIVDRSNKKSWFGTTPILLLATMSATRNLPLFVVSGTKELDDYISKIQKDIPKHLDRSRKIVLGSLLLALGAALVYSFHLAYGPLSQERESHYPQQSVAYLRAHPCKGNIFNSYDYGGYLIWKLPGQKVYIDGRMPTWQPYMSRYERIIAHPDKAYKSEFQRYNVRCALISGGDAGYIVPVLKKAHWEIAVQDNGAVLLLAPTK